MDSKDARESLESGGGGTRCRCSNGRRTMAAAFVIQSLLTATCAALSLTFFISQQHKPSPQPSPSPELSQDTGILLQKLNTDELKFMAIWNQSVELNNEKSIKLSYAGPYIVYLWACAKKISNSEGNLSLEQGVKSFHLQTLRDGECQKMQSVFMLSEKSEVTFKVESIKENFQIEELVLGLHYMLGSQRFKTPQTKDKNSSWM